MAPPYLATRPTDSNEHYKDRDSARAHRVSHYSPYLSTKRIGFHQSAKIGPFGCYIRLDEVGLPKTGKIIHARTGCLCKEYYRDALVMNQLWKWVYVDSVELQIKPEAAQRFARDLAEQWRIKPLPLGEVQKRLSYLVAEIKQVMMSALDRRDQ